MLAVLVTIVLVVIAIGRTLSWLEFSNSMENLNVATVLEMSRGGPKLVPTLEGRPRIEKPPLTAWITSLGVRSATLAELDDLDPLRRREAYADLATQIRLTALITAALMLLAIYDFARTIGGSRVGAIAVVVCASSLFFLRFARFATTDVQLTLWLTVANAFLARAILNGVTWKKCARAGAGARARVHEQRPGLARSIDPARARVHRVATCVRRARTNRITIAKRRRDCRCDGPHASCRALVVRAGGAKRSVDHQALAKRNQIPPAPIVFAAATCWFT